MSFYSDAPFRIVDLNKFLSWLNSDEAFSKPIDFGHLVKICQSQGIISVRIPEHLKTLPLFRLGKSRSEAAQLVHLEEFHRKSRSFPVFFLENNQTLASVYEILVMILRKQYRGPLFFIADFSWGEEIFLNPQNRLEVAFIACERFADFTGWQKATLLSQTNPRDANLF